MHSTSLVTLLISISVCSLFCQGSKEVLFSIRWMPGSDLNFLTYGKSHLGFWKVNTADGGKLHLTKRSGVFEVWGIEFSTDQ